MQQEPFECRHCRNERENTGRNMIAELVILGLLAMPVNYILERQTDKSLVEWLAYLVNLYVDIWKRILR